MRISTRTLISLLLFVSPCFAQRSTFWAQNVSSALQPITLEASCTGNGTANYTPCSSAMTVTAGDTIVCNVTGVSGGNQLTGTVVDPVNGFYDNVYGIIHPAASLSWVQTAVKANSAGGSITPLLFYSATPSTRATISCYAFKSTATSNVLDGGGVEQTASATVTNPTSGTATAPTNNNEAVVAYMSRSSSTAPSSGGGAWLPSGTLTVVGSSSVRQASEYQIQTTASAVNGSFTGNGSSLATIDSQLAILPSGTTGGYRSFSGTFMALGAPGSAPTGTTSTSTIGDATSALSSINSHGYSWTLGGTAPTYDTGVNPTGTGTILAEGVAHSFGDAGSSIKVAGGTATGYYSLQDLLVGMGTPHWYSFFYRMGTGGASSSPCDDGYVSGAATEPQMIIQADTVTSSTFQWKMEGSSPSYGSAFSGTLNAGTDYWIQEHIAGVNERYHQVLSYSKSGSTWSLIDTLNEDVLCSNAATGSCSAPPTAATTTGTASSGSTALTVASGTGIVVGQVVTGTGIPDPSQTGNPSWTVVAAVAGTSVTLSQNTTASLSGTAVNFYTPPAHFVAGTNGTISAGSTSLTVVTPGTGTIAVGQAVGGAGILQGTVVTAVSLPTVTLSIPATASMTNGGVTFWTVPTGGGFAFGKNAGGSCSITGDQWWSGMLYDPSGTWRDFAPN